MTKFEELVSAQGEAGKKVLSYIESCRSFAFKFALGFSEYLECPPHTFGWLEDPEKEAILPVDFLRTNLRPPKQTGEWKFDLRILFGDRNGYYTVDLTFKKKENEFHLTHWNKVSAIPEAATASDLLQTYEYIFSRIKRFLDNITDYVFPDTESEKSPIGFLLPGWSNLTEWPGGKRK